MLQLPDKYLMPDCLTDIKEVSACYEISLFLLEKYFEAFARLERETHSDTAKEIGLEHFEKMLGIVPGASDTTEERRFRVQIVETVTDVLSFERLERLVKKIAGEGSSVTYDSDTKKLTVKCALTSQKMFSLLKKTIEGFVPMDVTAECILLFNRFSDLGDKTFAQLKNKTFNENKRTVL